MKKTTNKYKMSKKCRDSLGLLREIDSWNKPQPFSMRAALAEIKKKILEDRNF